MEINKRILSILNYASKPMHIEMNKASYNKLTIDTLNLLKEKDIKIFINNDIKSMKVSKYKLDCFAYKNEICRALATPIDCDNCKFYRNDITWNKIQKDITSYSGGVLND